MAESTGALKAKNAQRNNAKRATLQMFRDRKPAESTFECELTPGEKSTLFLVAIGAVEYDKLIDLCPPTKQQIGDNIAFDEDKFKPLLLSKVIQEPAGSPEDWREILGSDNMGRGEVTDLYYACVNVCSRTLGLKVINPFENDSERTATSS